MKWMAINAFSLLLLLTATSKRDSSPVLVQCSNATLSTDGDTGLCWKEGASVVCNSLEHGLSEAERLGTSMLVENTNQCKFSDQCRLKFKPHEDDRYSSSALKFNTSSVQKGKQVIYTQIQLQQQDQSSAFRCSPGFIPYNDSNCMCLESVKDIVKCAAVGDSQTAFLQDGFCMTYSKVTDSIAIASSLYACPPVNTSLLDDKTSFNFLPDNVSLLQEITCGRLNRQGFLCSECRHGYMPLAHSYRLKCIPCELSRRQLAINWMSYLALAILPQCILFLLMAIFRVGVTAPPFVSMVQVCQAVTTPLYVQIMIQQFSCRAIPQNRMGMGLFQSFVTFYGLFNLEFLRILGPSFCLNLDTIELQLLDYASAFTPLLLIILAYILVELHSRSFKPIMLIWRLVQICLGRFQREWHLKSSLVETFASFLLLSWIKLLFISYSLFTTTCVLTVDSDGNVFEDCSHLYYSPNVKLFDKTHLVLGIHIITIIVCIIVVIVPLLLLLLYPFKFFQNVLNKCGCNFQTLRVFMDSFQGSFRDGTDGGTDCRWFSSAYLIGRIILLLLAVVARNRYFFPIASMILMAYTLAVGVIQPHKKSAHNTFEAALLMILAAFYAAHGATSIAQLATKRGFLLPSIVLTFALGILPIVVSVGYLVWWIVKVKLSGTRFCTCVCVPQWWQRRRTFLEDSLPDRVNNPQDYQLLSLPYEEYL